MPSEFSKAFDAWMEKEGDKMFKELMYKDGMMDGRLWAPRLMKAAWFAGGVAADQQQLDTMKATETKL